MFFHNLFALILLFAVEEWFSIEFSLIDSGQSNVIILILQAQQLDCRGDTAVGSIAEAHVQSRVCSVNGLY